MDSRRILHWRYLCGVYAGFLSIPLLCLAQQNLPNENDVLADIPTVLSASRLSQPVAEAPSAMTVIDREMIVASGYREIPDLLHLVPGMYVAYVTYAKGVYPITSYHGLAREVLAKMQVLVDGRSIYNNTLGGIDWSQLPLDIEDIERIEVVRGPSSATHGIGAFLGTISIITRHASQDKGSHISAIVGEKDILDGFIRHGGSNGNLDYRLGLGHRSDGGFDKLNDPRQNTYANLRMDYRMRPADSIHFQTGISKEERTAGNLYNFDNVDHLRNVPIGTHFEQLRWQHIFDASNELSVQAYHYFLHQDDRGLTLPYTELANKQFLIDDSETIRRYELELQHTLSVASDWRLVWGAGWRRDRLVAPSWLNAPETNVVKRLFAHGEWRPFSQLQLSAGALREDSDLAGAHVAPRAALNYQLSPRHAFRVSWSKALRTPSIIERKALRQYYFDTVVFGPFFIGKENLRPETIISRELGYVANLLDNRLALDLKLYRDAESDFLHSYRLEPSQVYPQSIKNADNLTQSGAELSINYRPFHGSLISAGFTHAYATGTDVLDNYSEATPRHSINFLASRAFDNGFSLSGQYLQQGSLRAIGYSEQQALSRRVDVRLAQRFGEKQKNSEAALVVQNLFDEKNTEFRANTIINRRLWLSFKSEF